MVSRKTSMYVIGILTGILTYMQTQFGLEIEVATVGASALALVTYFQFQAKLDLQKIAQSNKFKDPKFYVGLVAALLPQVGAIFGIDLPVETISVVLTGILTLLFGVAFKRKAA